jgi:hypothetical protein
MGSAHGGAAFGALLGVGINESLIAGAAALRIEVEISIALHKPRAVAESLKLRIVS